VKLSEIFLAGNSGEGDSPAITENEKKTPEEKKKEKAINSEYGSSESGEDKPQRAEIMDDESSDGGMSGEGERGEKRREGEE
jgi:hypothetical protein